MVYYDCTKNKHYRPIPNWSFGKRENTFKSTFIDRNRVSKLKLKLAEPLFGKKESDKTKEQ